ncbi:MAG: hypothetical protein ARM1_0268 [Candidatus Micrarchaeota archaeon]|nr:MAG: hypothetical protein ARM1_0268 [Candidatus Micrarchaeota archaeon]
MDSYKLVLIIFIGLILLLEILNFLSKGTLLSGAWTSLPAAFSAALTYASNNGNLTLTCSALANEGNGLGFAEFCNQVPSYWIAATQWMAKNVGPYAPRVLAWWDYGDWINWFGFSNTVIRGDNAFAKEDYGVAAHFVFTTADGFGPAALASYMNNNQSEYVVFSQGLISKWGALDFLACIDINATSEQYAIQQGKLVGQPFLLGTSPCELKHNPVYALIPIPLNNSINVLETDFCNIPSASKSSNNTVYLRVWLTNSLGAGFLNLVDQNTTICIPRESPGTWPLYYGNGTRLNAYVNIQNYNQAQITTAKIDNITQDFIVTLVIYVPNSNGSITDAPTEFYNSPFYEGFFLGKLPGFVQVFPNTTESGVNFINYTLPLRIFKLVNYTGGLPKVTPKPPYIKNNYTVPG